MDIIILNIEFGEHKILASKVLYSVIVKCVSSTNQIKKREVWRGVDEYTELKEQIEKNESFPDLGIKLKSFLKLSIWQSEKDPKVIDQRSKEFSAFILLIQKTIFLLTIQPVKFFCQGFIINYSKKRRNSIACCKTSSKSKTIEEQESFVAISHTDLVPYKKEWSRVKDQLEIAGGRYKEVSTQLPELLVLSDSDLTLLLTDKLARQCRLSDTRQSADSQYAAAARTLSIKTTNSSTQTVTNPRTQTTFIKSESDSLTCSRVFNRGASSS